MSFTYTLKHQIQANNMAKDAERWQYICKTIKIALNPGLMYDFKAQKH